MERDHSECHDGCFAPNLAMKQLLRHSGAIISKEKKQMRT